MNIYKHIHAHTLFPQDVCNITCKETCSMLLCSFLVPSRHLELNLINKNVYFFFIIINRFVYVLCSVTQLCPTLCGPMDYSPSDSPVPGIFRARILEWVACPPPEDVPDPVTEPTNQVSPAFAGGFFTIGATWKSTG